MGKSWSAFDNAPGRPGPEAGATLLSEQSPVPTRPNLDALGACFVPGPAAPSKCA